jgi:hypothetical protein
MDFITVVANCFWYHRHFVAWLFPRRTRTSLAGYHSWKAEGRFFLWGFSIRDIRGHMGVVWKYSRVPLELMSSHLLAYEHYIPMATWGTGSTFVPKKQDVIPCTTVFSTVVSLHPDSLWLKANIQFIQCSKVMQSARCNRTSLGGSSCVLSYVPNLALGWSGTSWPGDAWLHHRIATCRAKLAMGRAFSRPEDVTACAPKDNRILVPMPPPPLFLATCHNLSVGKGELVRLSTVL